MGNCMAKNQNQGLEISKKRQEIMIPIEINQDQCKRSSVIYLPEPQIWASNSLQQCVKSNYDKIEQKESNFAQQNNISNSHELIISKQKWNKIEAQIDSLQNKYDCKIIQSVSNDQNQGESQIASLTFNNKELLLIYGNIINQRCDAIINPCNNKSLQTNSNELSGVAKAVAQFAGPEYQNHLKKSKFFNQKQIKGDLFVTQNDNFSHIISIPIQHNEIPNQNLDQFPLHIQNIFKIVQEKKIQSFAMPIFNGGCDFQAVSDIILFETIQQFSKQNILKKVIIVEVNYDNAQQMLKVFNKNLQNYASKLNLDIFEFNEQVYKKPINNVSISIIYSNLNKLNKLQQNMKNIFKEVDSIEIEWKVLNLLEQDLNDVSQFVNQYSKKIDGQIQFGNIIKIYCTSESCSVINKYLENIKSKVIYPNTWIPQTQNCIKVELASNNQEYNMVSDLFNKTLQNKKIYRIMRIQNLQLYQNFNYDRKLLIQNRSNQLQYQERERYVWHGTRQNNPKIIYEGTKEGFDSTFSNDTCAWGKGVYFADNAYYSSGFAYTLNSYDDQQYQGKLVFLLCLVCTGKIKIQNQDQSLRRAPNGYDCVSSPNHDQFILYGMDVRRAYPAYEITFQ